MRVLILLLGSLALTLIPAQAGHSGPLVLLRVHVQTTGPGLSTMEAREINIPPDNEAIQIRVIPEVTEQELVDVRSEPSGSVRLFFNHTGQVNLDAVTAQNQGRILVVMIDGYVVYAPTIDEEISNGQLVIPHPLPAEIVQVLKKTADRNAEQARHM